MRSSIVLAAVMGSTITIISWSLMLVSWPTMKTAKPIVGRKITAISGPTSQQIMKQMSSKCVPVSVPAAAPWVARDSRYHQHQSRPFAASLQNIMQENKSFHFFTFLLMNSTPSNPQIVSFAAKNVCSDDVFIQSIKSSSIVWFANFKIKIRFHVRWFKASSAVDRHPRGNDKLNAPHTIEKG